MSTSKIKAITIYGESSFVPKILSQVFKDFLVETFPYSDFAATAINVRPSIVLADVRNQIVFDKAIKPYLQFYSLYPLILLIPNDIIIPEGCHGSQLEVLAKPVTHKELSIAIENHTLDCVCQITQDLFLNHKTMSLIKIAQNLSRTTNGLPRRYAPRNDGMIIRHCEEHLPRRSSKSEGGGDAAICWSEQAGAGVETKLTSLEFKILKYLLEVKATTEKEILTNVFGYHDASSTNTFKVHLHRLRQKLGFDLIERKDNGEYIIRTPEIAD
jgi:DNA-binding response OmpR family regulator